MASQCATYALNRILLASQAENWYTLLIRKVVISSATVTTIAGDGQGFVDGVGTLARFTNAMFIAFDPTGTYVLVVRRLVRSVRLLAAGRVAFRLAVRQQCHSPY